MQKWARQKEKEKPNEENALRHRYKITLIVHDFIKAKQTRYTVSCPKLKCFIYPY